MRNKKNTNCCWCGKNLPSGVGEAFFVDEEDELLGIGPMGRSGWMSQCENRIECGNRKKEIEEKTAEKKRQREAVDAIERALFSSDGKYPEGKNNWPSGIEYARRGKGHDIYGGGVCYVDTGVAIWHVRNNGMDGDDWSRNNIRTGGAGAIGHIFERTSERVDFLRNHCENLSEKRRIDEEEKNIAEKKERERIREGLNKFFVRTGWSVDRIREELNKTGAKTFCPKELAEGSRATVHLTVEKIIEIMKP